MKVIELLEKVAALAGVENISVDSLDAPVPKELEAAVNENIYNYAGALSNGKIRAKIKKDILDDVDNSIFDLAKELKLSENELGEIAKGSTKDKIRTLYTRLDAAKQDTPNEETPEMKALKAQIDELNAKLSETSNAYTGLSSRYESTVVNYNLNNLLEGQNLLLKKDQVVDLINTRLAKKLQNDGITLGADENGAIALFDIKERVVKKDNAGRPLDVKKVVLDYLNEDKLIKVSEPAKQVATSQVQPTDKTAALKQKWLQSK